MNKKLSKPVVILFTAALLILMSVNVSPAQEKPDAEGQSVKFVYKGKIVNAPSRAQDGVRWIAVDGAKKAFEAMGAVCSYDDGAKLLAVDPAGEVKEIGSMPAPSTGSGVKPFYIVLKSKIHRTTHTMEAGKAYVPLKAVKKTVAAMGFTVNFDEKTMIMTVSDDKKDGSKKDDVKKKTDVKKDQPGALPDVSKIPGADREEVKKYMDALKILFDKYKPSGKDMKVFDGALSDIGKGEIKVDGLVRIIGKYAEAVEEMKKLNPPNVETREIQNLGLGVFEKMKRLMEKAKKLLSMDKGLDNPKLLEEIMILNREISRESQEFDQKARAIRKKYDLGKP